MIGFVPVENLCLPHVPLADVVVMQSLLGLLGLISLAPRHTTTCNQEIGSARTVAIYNLQVALNAGDVALQKPNRATLSWISKNS